MSDDRQERLRKILIKKKLLSDRRKTEKFLLGETSLNDYVKKKIAQFPELQAITDDYCKIYMNYAQLEEQMSAFAAALQSFGLQKGEFVDIFTENNGRWCVVEQGAMRCGAVCTLRGSNAPIEELDYIINHSDAVGLILKDGVLLNKLKPFLGKYNFKFIIATHEDLILFLTQVWLNQRKYLL